MTLYRPFLLRSCHSTLMVIIHSQYSTNPFSTGMSSLVFPCQPLAPATITPPPPSDHSGPAHQMYELLHLLPVRQSGQRANYRHAIQVTTESQLSTCYTGNYLLQRANYRHAIQVTTVDFSET